MLKPGTKVYFQWGVLDPAAPSPLGVAFSDAAELAF